MANPFKEAQQEAKRQKLLAECASMASGGTAALARAVNKYAKDAGVSKQVAARLLEDHRKG